MIRKSERGFTLIELVVVVAILAVLVGVSFPAVTAIEAGEKYRTAKEILENHAKAIKAFGEDIGRLPANLEELPTNPSNAVGWLGPYIDTPTGLADSEDPWMTPLGFQHITVDTCRLACAGEDRQLGTADDVTRLISIAPELRARTRFTVDHVNTAIDVYNDENLVTAPLAGTIDTVVGSLQAGGLLPTGKDWSRDSVGDKLLTSAAPVTYVESKNHPGTRRGYNKTDKFNPLGGNGSGSNGTGTTSGSGTSGSGTSGTSGSGTSGSGTSGTSGSGTSGSGTSGSGSGSSGSGSGGLLGFLLDILGGD